MSKATRKWEKGATPAELERVKLIETTISTITSLSRKVLTKVKALKKERSTIIMRCNVRRWRDHQ